MTSVNPTGESSATRTRSLIVAGIVPVIISVIATALMISWIPELPDPVATHWSGAGPDGFGSVWPAVFMPLGISLAYAVFAIAVAWRTTPSGRLTGTQKIVVVSSPWLTGLLTVAITGSIEMQRGLADARDAGDVSLLMLIGVVVGSALAVVGWFLLPPAEQPAVPGASPEPLDLAPTERVSWSSTARMGRGAMVLIAVAVVVSLGSVVLTAVAAPEGLVFALCAFVVLLAMALATAWWRVTADRRGLRVVSALGWPRVAIPVDDISGVHAITVDPTADFGGWGWRWDMAGRTGVITRRGAAIQVTRASGKKFVVTVDDAETAASVLAAVAAARTE